MAQSQGRICGDSPPTMRNLINATWRNAYVFSQSVLADPHGFQEFRNEDFTRMYGGENHAFSFSYSHLSMIINDFNIVGIAAFPRKTNSPLLIDADAMLPPPFTLQFLKVV